MRLALDTNVLACAEGVNGAAMKNTALNVVAKLPEDSSFLPVQVLGELFHLLVRKAGRSPERARAAIFLELAGRLPAD
jgi:predicted nucleic acid-binding protein